MLWIPRLIIVVLCVFGNSAEFDEKGDPWWWNDIFGDGSLISKVDEDVSIHTDFVYQHKCYQTYQ